MKTIKDILFWIIFSIMFTVLPTGLLLIVPLHYFFGDLVASAYFIIWVFTFLCLVCKGIETI